jgi:hypothetical protein
MCADNTCGQNIINQLMSSQGFNGVDGQKNADIVQPISAEDVIGLKLKLGERYKVVGGRFRLLFHDAKTCDDLKRELNSAMQKLTVDQLINIKSITITDFVPSLCYSINIVENDAGMD